VRWSRKHQACHPPMARGRPGPRDAQGRPGTPRDAQGPGPRDAQGRPGTPRDAQDAQDAQDARGRLGYLGNLVNLLNIQQLFHVEQSTRPTQADPGRTVPRGTRNPFSAGRQIPGGGVGPLHGASA
jgi:hypothetical protein